MVYFFLLHLQSLVQPIFLFFQNKFRVFFPKAKVVLKWYARLCNAKVLHHFLLAILHCHWLLALSIGIHWIYFSPHSTQTSALQFYQRDFCVPSFHLIVVERWHYCTAPNFGNKLRLASLRLIITASGQMTCNFESGLGRINIGLMCNFI